MLYSRLAPGTVDLLHTDIPYNLGDSGTITNLKDVIGRDGARTVRMSVGDYDQASYPFQEHIARWGPLMAESGVMVVWCSDDQLSHVKAACREAGAERADLLVWHVTNPMPVIRKSRLLSAAQVAVVAPFPGPRRLAENWLGQGPSSHNVWRGPSATSQREQRVLRIDPPDGDRVLIGQKPQWLAVKVAKLFGKQEGLCVDPCTGTGALLVGAMTCGMRVLGAEQRPWWAEEANRWLQTTQTSSLLARANTSTNGASKIGPPS